MVFVVLLQPAPSVTRRRVSVGEVNWHEATFPPGNGNDGVDPDSPIARGSLLECLQSVNLEMNSFVRNPLGAPETAALC